LLFAPADALELCTKPGECSGKVVFNTEAHSIRKTW